DGEPDAPGLVEKETGGLIAAVIAGEDRHPGFLHDRFRGGFVAHCAYRGGRRPNEREARALAAFGEFGVLREKAVARVQSRGPRAFRRIDDTLAVEVTVL